MLASFAIASLFFGIAIAGDPVAHLVDIVLQRVPADQILEVTTARSEDDTDKWTDYARQAKLVAQSYEEQAKEYKKLLESEIDLKKSEIDVIKDEIKVADDAKQEDKKQELETQKKAQELDLKRLERRKEMRDKEAKLAKAMRDEADALKRALDKDREMSKMKRELANNEKGEIELSDVEKIVKQRREIAEKKRGVLNSFKDHARKKEEAAKLQREVLDRRMKLLDAQRLVEAAQ